ncbi:FtsX-like permease family protein [Streptomyces sp. H27-D2]|uniref:FtsX-like permease family protein n=1 Tax=Streptomyces sp. H27-D2 TaxID=3046304 RepID=UPI003FA7B9A5
MGARLAVTGGREGWARTLMTAVGVGLGVAMLLFAAAAPAMNQARTDRGTARAPHPAAEPLKPGRNTLVTVETETIFRDAEISGRLLRPEGRDAPRPPGVFVLPKPGEMLVSPALRELLDADGSELLRERLNARVIGTIGDAGLIGPGELTYYAGDAHLGVGGRSGRIDRFAGEDTGRPLDPMLILAVLVGCVVLLMPVAVFIGTAVRFGGERRDRRLAALRLVGADIRMTRRIAAGEALCGALFGLLAGLAFFFLGRAFAGSVRVWDFSAFPADVRPAPALVALILLAVPAAAVLVTLFALRGIVIEPLGVVRDAPPKRRRLWWRVLMPLVGVALLWPLTDGLDAGGDPFHLIQVGAGAALLLFGVPAVLPWLVEAVVNLFRGGPLPWQLAVRRLQLSSGPAARAVSGITIAVAGAIALQMLFTGIQATHRQPPASSQPVNRPQVTGYAPEVADAVQLRATTEEFRATPGVRRVHSAVEAYVDKPGPRGPDALTGTQLTVADCATLRTMARLPSCEDGDVFLAGDSHGNDARDTVKPGGKVDLHSEGYDEPQGTPRLWTVPASALPVRTKLSPMGTEFPGILATPSTVDVTRLEDPSANFALWTDHGPDTVERVRTTAAHDDPQLRLDTPGAAKDAGQFTTVKNGLLVGATALLGLIGASMTVSQLEQLRERRRLLAVLVAFGTRRSTLGWSVFWQTAVPVALGLAVAVAGGLALGSILLMMVGEPVAFDLPDVALLSGIGGAVILLVTVVSLPPLWRMMRPDGLRTE